MEIECKNTSCKYCFENDCQLMTAKIDESGRCISFEEREEKRK